MSFDQVIEFIHEWDPLSDPQIKKGQPIASSSRQLPTVFYLVLAEAPAPTPWPSWKRGHVGNMFEAERNIYKNTTHSRKHTNEKMVFLGQFDNIISINGIAFHLRRGIVIPNFTWTTGQVEMRDEEINFNKEIFKHVVQCTNDRDNRKNSKPQFMFENECVNSFSYETGQVSFSNRTCIKIMTQTIPRTHFSYQFENRTQWLTVPVQVAYSATIDSKKTKTQDGNQVQWIGSNVTKKHINILGQEQN